MTDSASPPSFDGLLPSNLTHVGSVFHYTSALGFLGALNSGTLWATEAFGLNDVAELRHGWMFIRDWLRDQPCDEVIEELLSQVPLDASNNLSLDTLILCGSTVADDASQWRLYADNARGYCLELDSSIALQMCSKDPPPQRLPTARIRAWEKQDFSHIGPWLRVLYTETEKTAALSHLYRQALVLLEEAESNDLGTPEFEDSYTTYLDEVSGGALLTLAQCMKSSAFSGEAEVRCVVTMSNPAIDKHCNFRPSAYGVVRYVELGGAGSPWGETLDIVNRPQGRLPISSTRLGPGQLGRNSMDAALALLRRHGHPQLVHESAASVR